jgi:hypothetical protein
MPQPEYGAIHVDRALTDLSVKFSQDRDMFIANKVFPAVPVQYRSDKYFIYDRSYWFKSDAQLRGPGAESAGSGYEVSTSDYLTHVYAVHRDLDDQTRANADSQINLERDATEFVTQHLLQQMEQAWVSNFFTTGVWTTDVTGGTNFTKWDDYAGSDPIGDMRTAVITMAESTALKPNKLILSPHVWNKLQDHPDFLDRIKYSQKGIVGTDLLATMLGIDQVLIAWSVANTSAEGETASYSFNFGKNALFVHSPARAGLNTPAAGYTFTWKGLLGSGATGIRIKRFRLERNASDRIEGEIAYDQKVVSADLGYFFSGCVD